MSLFTKPISSSPSPSTSPSQQDVLITMGCPPVGKNKVVVEGHKAKDMRTFDQEDSTSMTESSTSSYDSLSSSCSSLESLGSPRRMTGRTEQSSEDDDKEGLLSINDPSQNNDALVMTLKAKLRSLLDDNHGSTKHPDILQIVDTLSTFNPSSFGTNIIDHPLFVGDFLALTCPNFPGRLEPAKGQERVVQYTLGKLSFNIFQPNKLVCTLRTVRNTVQKLDQPTEERAKQKFTYPLVLDITIHSEEHGDLDAILENEALCYASDDKPGRVMVTFSGASLKPSEQVASDATMLARWRKTFEGAYKKAKDESTLLGQLGQMALKIILGLTLPTDDENDFFHFHMKRSPVGYLDVLYLDEDLRITRGNRGTLVVVERLPWNQDDQDDGNKATAEHQAFKLSTNGY